MSLTASVLANILTKIAERSMSKDIKALFDEKNKRFNQHAKDIVDDILIKINPQIEKQLLTRNINREIHQFPVVELKKGKWDNGDFRDAVTIQSSLTESIDDSVPDNNFIGFLEKIGREVYDNPTFRLVDVTDENNLILGGSTFFKTLCASDKLLYEMIWRYPLSRSKIRKLLYKHNRFFLSWKNIINEVIRNHSFHHYSASLGCSVLTVLREDKQSSDYIYLITTSAREKNSVLDRHVIPSFMFEPVSDSFSEQKKELNVEVQVLREFGEEILGVEELSDAKLFAAQDALIRQNPALKDLRKMLSEGRAKLAITGLCLDLFRLRPEITCVLIIEDPLFYKKHRSKFRFNWETERMEPFRLFDDKAYNNLLLDKEKPLCPPGAAALIYGRDYAIKKINGR